MDSKFHNLPPQKRFRLMHQQEQEEKTIKRNCLLPAKKRKESRSPSPSPLPPNPPTTTYSLPAKKRICAIHPFDLNLDYKLPIENETQISDKKSLSLEKQKPKIVDECEEKVLHDDEDGIFCAICESTDGDPKDPIVFCDGCDLMVHTTCYGHPLVKGVPEGDWFCERCVAFQATKNDAVSCCLCPVLDGAMKPTIDGEKWAHIVCALFVPEVFFSDPIGREGVDCSKVPRKRWEGKCYVCKTRNGCVIECSEPNCPLAFHVACGLKEDLCIEYQQGKKKGAIVAGFCRKHSDMWEKEQKTGKYKIVARDR